MARSAVSLLAAALALTGLTAGRAAADEDAGGLTGTRMDEWIDTALAPLERAAAARQPLAVAAAIVSGDPLGAVGAALDDDAPILQVRPVEGTLSSFFGVRRDPFHHRRHQEHKGLDIVASRGTPVLAAGAGVVVCAKRERGYGRVVYIDHGNGLETRYAHLNSILVSQGDQVAAAAVIGTVGSSGRATGPHLHFEVREDGKAIEPTPVYQALGPTPPATLSPDQLAQAAAAEARASHARPAPARHRTKRDRTPHSHELRSARPQS